MMKTYQDTKKYITYNISSVLKKIISKEKLQTNKPNVFLKDFFFIKKALNQKQVSTHGYFTNLLEKKIKSITKSKYVVCTNSGTSALHLTLIASNVNEGDEVFVPSFNFVSAVNAIKYCNATPHFIDVEDETLGVDPLKLEQHIKKNFYYKNKKLINKKTMKHLKAIILVYTYGHPPKITNLLKICKFYNIQVIEDAAEALGTYYKKKHAGTFGNLGVLSFNGNKIITSGAGGAVLTNYKNIYKRVLDLSTLGKKKNSIFDYRFVGYNYRMASLNAALALSQIRNLKKVIKIKRSIYEIYNKGFKDLKYCHIVKEPNYSKSNYWQNAVFLKKKLINQRNKIIKKLRSQKIDVSIGWTLLNEMKHFKNCPKSDLTQSKIISKSIINLPSFK